MSAENLPEIARYRLTIAPADLEAYMKLAQAVASSGLFGSPAQCLIRILAGYELGFGAVASLMDISISEQGRLMVGAHLRAASIRASGRYDFRVDEHTDGVCSLTFLRRLGDDWRVLGTERLTFAEAEAKGWTLTRGGKKKEPWYATPKNMLYARCMTNGYRFHCPDLSGGVNLYDPDEFDQAPAPAPALPAGEITDAEFSVSPGEAPAAPPPEPVPNDQPPGETYLPGAIGDGPEYQELVALARSKGRSAMDLRALCGAAGARTLAHLPAAKVPWARALLADGQATALQVDAVMEMAAGLSIPGEAIKARLADLYGVTSLAHLTVPQIKEVGAKLLAALKARPAPQAAGAGTNSAS